MNKKYIFMDIDGTLLNHITMEIPEKTKEALKIMEAKGYDLYICTGRNYSTVNYNFGIKPKGYVLSMGALVRTEDEILYKNPFDKETVKHLIKQANINDIELNLETEVYCYAGARTHKNILPRFDEVTKKYWVHYEDYADEDVYKVMMYAKNEKDYHEFIDKFSNELQFQNVGFIEYYDEIQLIGNSKGNAIKNLARSGIVDLKNTIVIGDGLNDVSMFEIGAFSIAMGNGHDVLKNKADYITDDVGKDGFYKAFKKLGYLD